MVTNTGIRTVQPRDRLLRRHLLPGHRGRRDPDRLRLLGRPRAGRPRPRRSAAADAARRATRLLGATKPAERAGHRRARPVRHRAAPRHPRRHAVRRGRAEGPLAVRRPAGRGGGVAACSPWSTTPPTRSPTPRRRPTARAWPPGATCSSSGGVLQQFVHNTYTARRAGTALHRQRGAGRVRVHAGRRAAGRSAWRPGARPGGDPAPGGRRRAHLVGRRPALGRQPGERRLLDRRRGPAHHRRRRWASRCGSSRSPPPSSGCCRTWWRSAPTSSGCR